MIAPLTIVERLDIVVPGDPVAQGRARAYRCGGAIRFVDPEESVRWKALASLLMDREARRAGWTLAPGPLLVVVDAVFPRVLRLKGLERVRKDTKPDCDNLLKASLDAGNGVLWADDGQAAETTCRKWWAAPDERPAVHVVVLRLGGA